MSRPDGRVLALRGHAVAEVEALPSGRTVRATLPHADVEWAADDPDTDGPGWWAPGPNPGPGLTK